MYFRDNGDNSLWNVTGLGSSFNKERGRFEMKKSLWGKIFAVVLVLAFIVTLADPFSVKAAAKKTVRVATQKELNKALKNSKVGTIILRTNTVDPISITSTKSTKKKLIVDASYSVITNNAVFKSVTVENASKYIENVSGNKISVNADVPLEIAAGKTVDKLTFRWISPWMILRHVVREGASIKKIAFAESGKVTGTGNNTFSIEKTILGDIDEDPVDYRIDMEFDKNGRITGTTVEKLTAVSEEDDGRVHNYAFRYDERGNLYKIVISNPDWDYDLTEETFYYDDNNNLISYSEEYDDRPVCDYEYEYDASGKMIFSGYFDESRGREYTYSYDKNGRLVEEKGTYYDIVYGENGFEHEVTRGYTMKTKYNKSGCELKITYEWSGDADAVKSVVTYTYDKKGNRTGYCSEDYYSKDDPTNMNLYRNEYEFDEYGNLLNAYYVDSDGRRVNMDDITG